MRPELKMNTNTQEKKIDTPEDAKKAFFKCSICGKRLIERRKNGLWYFIFGKKYGKDQNTFIPVEIYIHGNIKMKCLRRSCRKENPKHWNIFNFFPVE